MTMMQSALGMFILIMYPFWIVLFYKHTLRDEPWFIRLFVASMTAIGALILSAVAVSIMLFGIALVFT